MNSEERNRFAEELLEAALGRYRRAEPLQGIEDRLLAKLESTQTSEGVLHLLWSWARGRDLRGLVPVEVCVVLLAAVVVSLLVAQHHRSVREPGAEYPQTRTMQTANAGRPEIKPAVELAAEAPAKPPAKKRTRIGIHSSLPVRSARAKRSHPGPQPQSWDGPRQEQFPTPEPLSEEEKLLLTYLRQTPVPMPISFHDPEQLKKELQPTPLEALRIEPPRPGPAQ